MRRLGLERDLDDYRIWQAWDEVVGPQVARNAQPQRLDTHRLIVAVRSPGWMQELTLLRKDICRRLNEWMGREVVGEIFLVVGKIEAAEQPRQRGSCAAKTTVLGRSEPAENLTGALDRLWQAARQHKPPQG